MLFIDGCAGCGKSVLASNIINALETYAPNKYPDAPKVRVSAPTGKAATLIDGETIHQVYQLRFDQDSDTARRLREGDDEVMEQMCPKKLATMQNAFRDVFGQVIDEISMVSHGKLAAIEQRCREAKDNSKVFGGVWTFTSGDFK